MNRRETGKMREKLEVEVEAYRKLARSQQRGRPWLRELRRALGLSVTEVATRLGCSRSMLYRVEQRETEGAERVDVVREVAGAMGCELVYAIVPKDGKTLEETAQWFKANPRWRTERQKERQQKKNDEKLEELQRWHDKRIWEEAADKMAAKMKAQWLERAKSYGYSTAKAEADLPHEPTPLERWATEPQWSSPEAERQAAVERAAKSRPEARTAEEMQRQGVSAEEALFRALEYAARRRAARVARVAE